MPSLSPAARNDAASARAVPCLVALACLAVSPAAAREVDDCLVDPSALVRVGSPVSGLVGDVMVARGDAVRRGQAIARLESDVEAAAAALDRFRAESRAGVAAQEARLAFSRARPERTEQLVGWGIASQERYEELLAEVAVDEQDLLREEQSRRLAELELARAESALANRTIRAPIDGIVIEHPLEAGEYVHQDAPLVVLARLDPLHVEVFLPVALYPEIRIGMEATVRPAPPIGGTYAARVSVVDRVFDPASNTFGVRLELPNPDSALPGGMRCTVDFPTVEAR